MLALAWADTGCRGATYLLKLDDDVFVHATRLMAALRRWSRPTAPDGVDKVRPLVNRFVSLSSFFVGN